MSAKSNYLQRNLSLLRDREFVAAVVVSAATLSVLFIVLFFAVRALIRPRSSPSRQQSSTRVGESQAIANESAPLLANVQQQQEGHFTSDTHETNLEDEEVAIPVWGTSRNLFRSSTAAAHCRGEHSSGGGGHQTPMSRSNLGPGGESPTPPPPPLSTDGNSPATATKKTAAVLSYGSTGANVQGPSGAADKTKKTVGQADIKTNTVSHNENEKGDDDGTTVTTSSNSISAPIPTGLKSLNLPQSTANAFSGESGTATPVRRVGTVDRGISPTPQWLSAADAERDESRGRALVSQTETLERARAAVTWQKVLLGDTDAQRAALAVEVSSLAAYRDQWEREVLPAIFNDLQSAAEELADAEAAMLTSVDRRRKVLRTVAAESVAQETVLLGRLTALVSQAGSTPSSLPASSRGTPRPMGMDGSSRLSTPTPRFLGVSPPPPAPIPTRKQENL